MNNVQRCLCHFYTWMRHSKQTATLLLTKRHANFDTSTSAKGYARVYELRMRNCSPWHTLAQARPTMPCIRLVIAASVLRSLGTRPSKNRKGGSGKSAGVEVYTAPGMQAHFRLAFD